MYQALYKPNQLIKGDGKTAFVTGWTPIKTIGKELEKGFFNYGVIGQLYSAQRGIDFLVRNLLLNPQITRIIILSATKEDRNSGSCQCLFDFFCHSVKGGGDNWIINSKIEGYIGEDIPLKQLESLRTSIEVHFYDNKETMLQDTIASNTFKLDYPQTRFKPHLFEKKEKVQSKRHGELYGHRIEAENIAQGWLKLLYRIRNQGITRPIGYDGNVQEVINLMMIIKNEPKDFHFESWLPVDKQAIDNYIPIMVNDASYEEGVKYTYGQRLRSWFGKDQVKQVIEKLIKEIDSASAVMSLWDAGSGNHEFILHKKEDIPFTDCTAINRFKRKPADSDHDHSGSPCLNHIWVRIINNKLSLTATFRSNDMFSAWVSNAMGLRTLQQYILDQLNEKGDLNLSMGYLITISQSAHIYDDCYDNVDKLLNKEYKLAKPKYEDSIGNFLIAIKDNKIEVKQCVSYSILHIFLERSPLKLIRLISHYNPNIESAHIGYLGLELQKASHCLKTGENYIQDK